ncbi:MAG: hypothetical protein FJX22_02625 [Alphaproteobacteria bacterium]|nr:hypothetical protein [Alphaproteobacteria bacterium]
MTQIFDAECLAELIEVVGVGGLQELMAVFFEEFQERYIALKQGYHDGNLEEMQRQAHALKSLCAGVGLVHLHLVAEQIDMAAKAKNLGEARHHSQQFLADTDVGLSALRGFVADHVAD